LIDSLLCIKNNNNYIKTFKDKFIQLETILNNKFIEHSENNISND